MSSRATGSLLRRLPHGRIFRLSLLRLQIRYYGDHPMEMDCATFQAYREQIAKALQKRKDAKKKCNAAKQVKKDAARLKKQLDKCIEIKTKGVMEKVECMSEEEQQAMEDMMDCVMAGIKSTCLKQVLQRYCKEQEMKRRFARLIKEKHIKDMVKKCASQLKGSSESEKADSAEECEDPEAEKAEKDHKKKIAFAQMCEERQQNEKCMAEVAKLLENAGCEKDEGSDSNETESKDSAKSDKTKDSNGEDSKKSKGEDSKKSKGKASKKSKGKAAKGESSKSNGEACKESKEKNGKSKDPKNDSKCEDDSQSGKSKEKNKKAKGSDKEANGSKKNRKARTLKKEQKKEKRRNLRVKSPSLLLSHHLRKRWINVCAKN
ncbi:micronuclear linker histone polyprotein [Drosophila serrata]|uniref:micronuclear linker histone polyprotein n=1 Tax=Drosophila serrata TaxID=7274 RepID=UPI000A1D137B|nr:micronuclear linker histone polyprotein [Drosophila serrata]